MILDLRRYRKVIIVILFAIVGICLLLLSGKKYSSDITDMLPDGSVAAKMLKYLHEENVAGRITVELQDCCCRALRDRSPRAPAARIKLLRNYPAVGTAGPGHARSTAEWL